MKMKNKQILAIYNNIRPIKQKQLPVKIGFAINKNLAAMDDAAKAYEEERMKILDRYGEKDENGLKKSEDGKEYLLKDKKAYKEAMDELWEIETDIPIHTVMIDDVAKCDSEKFDALTPFELEILEFMIEE